MTVVINEAAMNALLYSESGPLAMFIDKKARRVNELAFDYVSGRPPGPQIRSGLLKERLRYPGIVATAEGPTAWILTDARSPRQNFNYPRALEVGMGMEGNYAPLPGNQGPYHYPFLVPALREAFAEG